MILKTKRESESLEGLVPFRSQMCTKCASNDNANSMNSTLCRVQTKTMIIKLCLSLRPFVYGNILPGFQDNYGTCIASAILPDPIEYQRIHHS